MARLEFDDGLTLLRVPSARSTVIHRLACSRLCETDRPAYWIDARNVASTHALYDCAPSARSLENLRIGRAFTAYQHHSLVREVAREADPRTALIVAPNVADFYRDDDLLACEREDLLAATLTTLREVGRTFGCPVIATSDDDERADRASGFADRDVECVRTREGYRFDGEGVRTDGYWHGEYWQTTIPYWVDLCGAVEAFDPVTAHDRGLLEVSV